VVGPRLRQVLHQRLVLARFRHRHGKTLWPAANVKNFHVDVDFEMRTVLYRIRLSIDTHQIVGQHFISNRNGGEESKIAERQRERVCVRHRMGRGRDSVGHKISC
jgi:hypothetical protein